MIQISLIHSDAFLRLYLISLLLVIFPDLSSAGNEGFREQFIKNYKTFQFKAQEELIREKGAEIMPGEMRALIDEAMADNKGFNRRMYLLDIASAMASGYQHWHGGGEDLIKEIETLIKTELKLEEQRVARLMKWRKEERFLGNFVMKEHMANMKKAGVAPVIYPHWVHRIWFECKVCHQDIFIMNRWRTHISHANMEAGKQCGVCHDGKMAFGVDDECDRCHLAGKNEAERLHHADKVDHARIKKVADNLGAEWNYDKLSGKKLPVDRFGFIDWLKLKKMGVFKPIHSLQEDFNHEVRDNKILFKSKGKLKNVLFDHKVHSSWINCTSCHPEVFRKTLTNDVKMVRMAKGRFCGYCHGRVSFTFADCNRCHSQEKGTNESGAMLHIGAVGK